jgi:7,8-dihydropterin-6-yl-methyl-4-(beta-D-ribofuranosyl)aminobenzene 5'-phosphate synthase
MDEHWSSATVKDKGLVVLTACTHAGVINVLKHAQDCFPDVPLHAVLGGFHLSDVNEKVIPETVAGMKASGLKTIAAAHCTGSRALLALPQAFGEPVAAPQPLGNGTHSHRAIAASRPSRPRPSAITWWLR